MEVIAIQKSVLDGMKKELKALLEVNENATKKYTSIFKKEKWLENQEVCHDNEHNQKDFPEPQRQRTITVFQT